MARWWLKGGPSPQSSPAGRGSKTPRLPPPSPQPSPSGRGGQEPRRPSYAKVPTEGGRLTVLPRYNHGRTRRRLLLLTR